MFISTCFRFACFRLVCRRFLYLRFGCLRFCDQQNDSKLLELTAYAWSARCVALGIDFQNAGVYDLTDMNDFIGIFDKTVRQLGNMNQTVFMNANVDERTKAGNIAHGAFHFHSRLQIFQMQNAFLQNRAIERVTRVESGEASSLKMSLTVYGSLPSS